MSLRVGDLVWVRREHCAGNGVGGMIFTVLAVQRGCWKCGSCEGPRELAQPLARIVRWYGDNLGWYPQAYLMKIEPPSEELMLQDVAESELVTVEFPR